MSDLLVKAETKSDRERRGQWNLSLAVSPTVWGSAFLFQHLAHFIRRPQWVTISVQHRQRTHSLSEMLFASLYTCGHFISYTLIAPGWTSFSLQNHFHFSWSRLNKTFSQMLVQWIQQYNTDVSCTTTTHQTWQYFYNCPILMSPGGISPQFTVLSWHCCCPPLLQGLHFVDLEMLFCNKWLFEILFPSYQLEASTRHIRPQGWTGNLSYWTFSLWADTLLGWSIGLKSRCALAAAHLLIFITDSGLPNQIS